MFLDKLFAMKDIPNTLRIRLQCGLVQHVRDTRRSPGCSRDYFDGLLGLCSSVLPTFKPHRMERIRTKHVTTLYSIICFVE